MVFVLLLLKNKKKTINKIFIFFFFFYWCNFNNIYFNTNQLVLIYNLNTQNINTNLLNGIMLIHPPILYSFYMYIFYDVCVCVLLKKYDKHQINTTQITLFSQTIVIYLSIILGCLWAEQELSWGGWWSWDFVELIALNFFIYNLYLIHNKKNKKKLISEQLCIILIAILSVRFNIINSIHNFVSVETQNQYFYYILACTAIIMCILYLSVRLGVFTKYTYISVFFILLLLLLYFFYFINIFFLSLLNFNINVGVNLKNIYVNILFVFIILLYMKLTKSIKNAYIIFFILIGYNYNNVFIVTLLLVFFMPTTTIKVVHLTLLVFLFCTLNQLYIFSVVDILYSSYNNVQIKINHLVNITKYMEPIFNLNKDMYVLYNIHQNVPSSISGVFNSIFEKNLYINSNVVLELYNYNLQKLIEPFGNAILTLLTLLTLLLIRIGVRDFKIKI